MGLHRLTSITLGVPDPAASQTFFTDFGLTPAENPDTGGTWMQTRDGGSQLELVAASHRHLARLGVGAASVDDLALIADRAAAAGITPNSEPDSERLVVTEPVTGLTVEITVADPYQYSARADGPTVNTPSTTHRHDLPAPSVLEPADTADAHAPSNLTHLVYGSPDQTRTLAFFTDIIGFEISDEIPGTIAFTRCGEVHHNLAIQASPVPLIHHIAFEMDSVDDVVKGGSRMVEIDPERHTWGVGRHAIGSNWFWYLRDPSGTFVEYTADIDRITAQDAYEPKQWQGREFLYSFGPPTPRQFLRPDDLDEIIAASATA